MMMIMMMMKIGWKKNIFGTPQVVNANELQLVAWFQSALLDWSGSTKCSSAKTQNAQFAQSVAKIAWQLFRWIEINVLHTITLLQTSTTPKQKWNVVIVKTSKFHEFALRTLGYDLWIPSTSGVFSWSLLNEFPALHRII